MLVPIPKRRTARRLCPIRFSLAQFVNPSIPPDACIRVIMPPISAEKNNVRALSGLVTASRNVFTPTTSPVRGFHELRIVHPSHTKRAREM